MAFYFASVFSAGANFADRGQFPESAKIRTRKIFMLHGMSNFPKIAKLFSFKCKLNYQGRNETRVTLKVTKIWPTEWLLGKEARVRGKERILPMRNEHVYTCFTITDCIY